jgi:hypothetical protein
MRPENFFKYTFATALLLVASVGCTTGKKPENVAETTNKEEPGKAAPGATAPDGKPKPSPVVEQPAPITLAAGTKITARMSSGLSTKTAASGQTFAAELSQPLVVDGREVFPKGTTVTGMVVDSNPGGRIKGVAHLSIRLTEIRPEGLAPVKIATNAPTFNAKSTKKKDGVMIGIASGVGAAIGAIAGGGKGAAIGAGAGAGAGTAGVLATRGDAAVLPAETVVTFSLRDPVTVTKI